MGITERNPTAKAVRVQAFRHLPGGLEKVVGETLGGVKIVEMDVVVVAIALSGAQDTASEVELPLLTTPLSGRRSTDRRRTRQGAVTDAARRCARSA